MARKSLVDATFPALRSSAVLGRCTHGRNWGYITECCEAVATHVVPAYPDRFACEGHAVDDCWVRLEDACRLNPG